MLGLTFIRSLAITFFSVFLVSDIAVSYADSDNSKCKSVIQCADVMVKLANQLKRDNIVLLNRLQAQENKIDIIEKKTPSNRLVLVKDITIDMNQSPGSCQPHQQFLTADPNAFCFIRGVRGKFEGDHEIGVVSQANGAWMFDGSSCQPGVQFWIACYKTDYVSP